MSTRDEHERILDLFVKVFDEFDVLHVRPTDVVQVLKKKWPGLPQGGSARQARIVLAYDPRVLAAVGQQAADSGSVTLELGAASRLAQVRFRVIAQSPTTTRIGIERATATDARGASLSLAAPGSHSVAIVQRGE